MSNIDDVKAIILKKLESDMEETCHKYDLIKNLEVKPVTMSEWQDYCKTPLRNYNALLDIAMATFPEGDSFIRKPNEVTFFINNIRVELPTCLGSSLNIKLDWLRESYEPILRYTSSSVKQYFELLDDPTATWQDLAKCRYPGERSKLGLFVAWFTRGKWERIGRQEWEDIFTEDEARYSRNMEGYIQRKALVKKNLSTLRDILPRLMDFADVKAYHEGRWIKNEEILDVLNNPKWMDYDDEK